MYELERIASGSKQAHATLSFISSLVGTVHTSGANGEDVQVTAEELQIAADGSIKVGKIKVMNGDRAISRRYYGIILYSKLSLTLILVSRCDVEMKYRPKV